MVSSEAGVLKEVMQLGRISNRIVYRGEGVLSNVQLCWWMLLFQGFCLDVLWMGVEHVVRGVEGT